PESQPEGEPSASSTSFGASVPAQCEEGEWSGHGGEDGAEDTNFGMGDDMPLPFSVYEVQQGQAPQMMRVALTDVVVTTPAARSEALAGLERFVQEQQGGPYSGIRIHSSAVDLDTAVSVGDTVDIVGSVTPHRGYYMLTIDSSEDLTVTGTAALPEPIVVAAADLRPEDPAARPYEGVPVRVQMATVTDDDPCDGEFILDAVVRVDDRFAPNALATPEDGQVFVAVEGVLIYADDSYELAPPDSSSLE
ncbi:MAG: hypothetical protein AB1Z98_12235, partial [Nannocystaceae bacterium]